jgi:hypothetical protein
VIEVRAVDLNGDGLQDVVITRAQTSDGPSPVTVLVDRRGRFVQPPASFLTPAPVAQPHEIVLADFNGDGVSDVFIPATGTPGDQLLLTGPRGLVDRTTDGHYLPQNASGTLTAAAADVDGDGRVDLFVGDQRGLHDPGPRILLNAGQGRMTKEGVALPPSVRLAAGGYSASVFTDVDGDGSPDLVLGSAGSGGTPSRVLLNDGHGRFAVLRNALPSPPFGPGSKALSIRSTDVAGGSRRGSRDLLISWTRANGHGRALQLLINKGDGTFSDETSTRLPHITDSLPPFSRVDFVDVNGNGYPDIVTQPSQASLSSQVFINRGDPRLGVFTAAGSLSPHVQGPFAWLDANGRGNRDVLYSSVGATAQPVLLKQTGRALPPGIPSQVTATTALPGGVRVSWRYVWGATSYRVYRLLFPYQTVGPALKTTNRTSILDTGVPPGAVRYYSVVAINHVGSSHGSKAVPGARAPTQ